MRTVRAKSRRRGFTLIEVLVIIVLFFVVAFLMLPTRPEKKRAIQARCLSNLRQISLGFIQYADDNRQRYPMPTPSVEGGTMEGSNSNRVFPHFDKIRQYFAAGARDEIFVCPADPTKHPPTNAETFSDANLSYFLNPDAQLTNQPATILLAGDRNLKADGRAVKPGLLMLTTNLNLDWTTEVHLRGGNLGFADGHAEWQDRGKLNSVFARPAPEVRRLLVP